MPASFPHPCKSDWSAEQYFVSEILSASLLRCQSILDEPLRITEDEALSKLHYVNAFGLEKFCAFMYQLPKFIGEHPNVSGSCLLLVYLLFYPHGGGGVSDSTDYNAIYIQGLMPGVPDSLAQITPLPAGQGSKNRSLNWYLLELFVFLF